MDRAHFPDGQLRAYLDQALPDLEAKALQAHLAGCSFCQERMQELTERKNRVGLQLNLIQPDRTNNLLSAATARTHLQTRILHKESVSMFQRLFNQHRLAWIALSLSLILALSMAFLPVRALANNFLELFRVQRVTVVEVDPGNLPEALASSPRLEQLFARDIKYEEFGEQENVTTATQASELAGFSVRLPGGMKEELSLKVNPAGHMEYLVDLEMLQNILQEMGKENIQLPPELDGARVSVEIPHSVVASYGKCGLEQAEKQDPDEPHIIRTPECTIFIQSPSPEVNAPARLDLLNLGQAYLQMIGMPQEEAEVFSRNIDWTTTLVVPLPIGGTSYREIPVDGVTGTLIAEDTSSYMLMWVKDSIIYALTGPGSPQTAVRIANSIP